MVLLLVLRLLRACWSIGQPKLHVFEAGSDLHSERHEDGSHLRRLGGTLALALQRRPAQLAALTTSHESQLPASLQMK